MKIVARPAWACTSQTQPLIRQVPEKPEDLSLSFRHKYPGGAGAGPRVGSAKHPREDRIDVFGVVAKVEFLFDLSG